MDCLKVVMSRLELYNSERLVCTSRQRLTWKLSALTLRSLRPMEKLKGNSLAPISELAINEFQISEQWFIAYNLEDKTRKNSILKSRVHIGNNYESPSPAVHHMHCLHHIDNQHIIFNWHRSCWHYQEDRKLSVIGRAKTKSFLIFTPISSNL